MDLYWARGMSMMLPLIESLGIKVCLEDTIMIDLKSKIRLAKRVLDFSKSL
ncbi:MAG: hypothetical protein Ct9H300mP28_07110 [Pseudomonadota bacterium]|nr:MAG: hypothetical protein Ct9H300mP28_07110 [Pseudomonadota bacterium]